MPFDTAIRSGLRREQPSYGFWLTYPSTGVAKTFLRATAQHSTGGFKWVVVDGEHGLISDAHYYDLCNAVASEGASPIIRIPFGRDWMIKRALDSGAHGIMSPMCHTADEARNIVSYTKYPPSGTRGYGPLFAPHAFPGVRPGAEYDQGADQALLVILQIESRDGVNNVEEIAKVDGVDVLLIGPFDLANQLGVPRGSEEHEHAIHRVLQACKAAKKKAAIYCTNGGDARRRVEQGFDMVAITTDFGLLSTAMMRELSVASGTEVMDPGQGAY